MTTGRINQVATNQKKWKPLCSGNRFDVRNLCVWNFDCVLASVSQLSCTTAPLRRQHSARNRAKRRQKNGLSSTSAVIIIALLGARIHFSNGWSNHWSIQLQRKSTGHPEVDNEAYDEKAKKEKRINDSLIKHLLNVNQKQKTATREILWNRGKMNLKKLKLNSIQIQFIIF